jgi:lysozyme family protein
MAWGAVLAVGAVVVVASTFLLRDRIRRGPRLVGLAAGAVAVGLGAIGLQDGASPAEWVLTPAVLAVLAVLHDRLLFAGEGPRRI